MWKDSWSFKPNKFYNSTIPVLIPVDIPLSLKTTFISCRVEIKANQCLYLQQKGISGKAATQLHIIVGNKGQPKSGYISLADIINNLCTPMNDLNRDCLFYGCIINSRFNIKTCLLDKRRMIVISDGMDKRGVYKHVLKQLSQYSIFGEFNIGELIIAPIAIPR